MKKLIIVLAAIAMAGVTQASSFNWTSGGMASTKNIYSVDGSTLLYNANSSAMLYLFDVATISQGDLLAGIRGGSAITAYTSVASQTIASNSRITAQGFTYGTTGNDYSFYTAIVDGDNLFLSASVTVGAQASDTTAVNINQLATSTKNVFSDSSTAFSTAGWYNASGSSPTPPAPEPTSGLLMLVGLGALALRRKRA